MPLPSPTTASRRARPATLLFAFALLLGAGACGPTESDDDAAGSGEDTTVVDPNRPPLLADQPYTDAEASDAQVLDLWVPSDADGPSPLVVLIHGGGWVEGDKEQIASKRRALLERGFAVASIDYRLSGEATFPAAVSDAKAAIRWLRANGPDVGVDPDRIAAWGESAGANLAALLGVTGDQTTGLDDPALGHADTSSAVQAVVDWFGPVDLLQLQTQAVNDGVCPDPYDHDASDSFESQWLGESLQSDIAVAELTDPIAYLPGAATLPPFSIAHGDDDCVVDVEQSLLLAGALEEAGQRPQLVILSGAAHMDGRFDAEVLEPTIDWLEQVLPR